MQAVIGRTRGATCRYLPTAEMHWAGTHPGAAMDAAGVEAKGLGVLSAAAACSRGSRATDRPMRRVRAVQVAVRAAPARRQPAGLVRQAPPHRGTSISARAGEGMDDAVETLPTARTKQPDTGGNQGVGEAPSAGRRGALRLRTEEDSGWEQKVKGLLGLGVDSLTR
jgi:hypothetical protein